MRSSRRSFLSGGAGLAAAVLAMRQSLPSALAASPETSLHAPVSTPPARGASSGNLNALSAILKAVPDQTWIKIPNTEMRSLYPADALLSPRNAPSARGNTGPASVWIAWNGAAYDPARHRLYFWGGGHTDYGGNEVYCFDLELLQGTRLTDPSPLGPPVPNECCASASQPRDGTPSPWHTYGAFAWCPLTQSIWIPSQGDYCALGNPNQSCVHANSHAMWEFKPGRKTSWRKVGIFPWPPANERGYGGYLEMVWVDAIEKFYLWGSGLGIWFDPVKNTYSDWSLLGPNVGGGVAVYDPAGNTIYLEAYGYLLTLNASTTGPGASGTDESGKPIRGAGLAPKGIRQLLTNSPSDRPPGLAYDAGMIWDPVNKMLVFNSGDAAMVALEPGTKTWRKLDNAGQKDAPQLKHSVLTKLKYIPELKCLAAYYDAEDGLRCYKTGNLASAPKIDPTGTKK